MEGTDGIKREVLQGVQTVRISRSYELPCIEANKDIYDALVPRFVGKKVLVESEELNGLFSVGMDEDNIILTEVFE